MASPERQLCPKCKKLKNLNASNYKAGRDVGIFSKTCLQCLAQTAEKYAMKKAKKDNNKENPQNPDSQDDNHADEDGSNQWLGLSKLDLDLFLETISADDLTSFSALVDISPLICGEMNLREKADLLAKTIWERLKYRFMSVSINKCLLQLTVNLAIKALITTSKHLPPALCITVRKGIPANTSRKKGKPRASNVTRIGWIHSSARVGCISPLQKEVQPPLLSLNTRMTMSPTATLRSLMGSRNIFLQIHI